MGGTHNVRKIEDGSNNPEEEGHPLVPQVPGPSQRLYLVLRRAYYLP